MPQSADECLIDGYHMDESILGTQVHISETNLSDTLDTLVYDTYTVVGYVASPLYMDMNRAPLLSATVHWRTVSMSLRPD